MVIKNQTEVIRNNIMNDDDKTKKETPYEYQYNFIKGQLRDDILG